MRKICLLFVLSIVSVFSIPAQTTDKSADNSAETESVKVESESPKPESIPAETVAETRKTGAAEEKKKEITEVEKTLAIRETKAEMPETKKPEITEEIKAAVVEVKKAAVIEDKKPAAIEAEKKPAAPILEAKTFSLGALSTGNAAVDGYIEEFSELYDIDPRLIYAQMSQESSFKARATSSKGASGFMQLMPATARRFGVTNIYNPKQNIKAGVKYMRWLLDKFGGDTRLALAGYNAGEGSVMKYGNKIPPYRETQNYVAKIMNHYELLTNQNSALAQNGQPTDK